MFTRWLHGSILLLALSATAAFAYAADSAADSAAPSHPCASVIHPDARLACYDKAFPPVAAAQTRAEDSRAQALHNFGLSGAQVHKPSTPEQKATPDRIEAKVVSVRQDASRRRLVTLDNGQVWLLTQSSHRGYISPGDAVVIRAAALSSYMLITKAGIPLRARRLR